MTASSGAFPEFAPFPQPLRSEQPQPPQQAAQSTWSQQSEPDGAATVSMRIAAISQQLASECGEIRDQAARREAQHVEKAADELKAFQQEARQAIEQVEAQLAKQKQRDQDNADTRGIEPEEYDFGGSDDDTSDEDIFG